MDAGPVNTVIKNAVDTLSAELKADKGFAWAWQCNLAMMAYDAGAPHRESNIRAASFMHTLFGVDVTSFPEYQAIVGG
jgi:hypothetical protein